MTRVALQPDRHGRLMIGGDDHAGGGPELTIVHPATEEVVAVLNESTAGQVDQAVKSARETFDSGTWSRMAGDDRADLLERAWKHLHEHRDELVDTIVAEVGCPITTTRQLQVDSALQMLGWYAQAARRDRTRHLEPDLGPLPSMSLVQHVPVGAVAAITGYNYPLILALNKLGPALAAGCTVVLMPSPRTPLTTLLLGRLLNEAGVPPGVINTAVGGAARAQQLTEHPFVDHVSFTGSVEVGVKVMQQAAPTLKRLVLELGGKSPAVFLPDCDLEPYVGNVHLRYSRNAGQGCQSPTRILVHRSQWDAFVDLSRDAIGAIRVGDPWREDTQVGPVISAQHRDRVQGYVDKALAEGGKILAGAAAPDTGRGYWVPTTLVGGVSNTSRVCQEEIFGPVSVAIPYDDVDEAIAIANASPFGLSTYLYGSDVAEARLLSSRFRVGAVYINGGGALRPDAPNGGMKMSGFGREQGEESILEFLEPQHVQWPL